MRKKAVISMNEERIIDIETRLTYQEAAMQELSDIIAEQGTLIDRLCAELEAVKQRVREQGESNIAPLSEERPPPHY